MTASGDSLLSGLATFLSFGLTVYMWLVIIRAVISWVNPHPRNPIVQFLARVTDPVLDQVRRILPWRFGGIDFSPILLILVIIFLNDFVVFSLKGLARGMPASGVLPIFIISLVRLIQGLLFALMIIVIARAVISWISPDPYNPIVRFVYGVTEPFLYPLRRLLPLIVGGFDLSPLILLVLIYLANSLLDSVMAMVGRGF